MLKDPVKEYIIISPGGGSLVAGLYKAVLKDPVKINTFACLMVARLTELYSPMSNCTVFFKGVSIDTCLAVVSHHSSSSLVYQTPQ